MRSYRLYAVFQRRRYLHSKVVMTSLLGPAVLLQSPLLMIHLCVNNVIVCNLTLAAASGLPTRDIVTSRTLEAMYRKRRTIIDSEDAVTEKCDSVHYGLGRGCCGSSWPCGRSVWGTPC